MSLTDDGHARLRAVNRIIRHASAKRIAVVAAGVAAVPLLAGCFNGFDAQTSVQPPSGDGLNTQVGNVQIRSAVWVRNPATPTSFVLSATFVNTGGEPDALTSITTEPRGTATITGGTINMLKFSEARAGSRAGELVNLTGALVPPSGYIQTTFTFAKAGAVTGSVMTVPNEGIYAGVIPGVTVSPSPKKSESASVSTSPHSTGSESASASATATESRKP